MTRQLVELVDDENLVPVPDWCRRQTGDDHLAHVLDLGMRGRVDLEHVDVAAFRDLDTRVAGPAGVSGGPPLAVECAGEDPGRGRLAHAARSGEHEGLGHPLSGDRVSQRLRHATLPDYVLETLRAILAGEALVGHGRTHVEAARLTATRKSLRHMSVVYLALLPSGPDAVRRLKLHRIRAAVRPVTPSVESSVYLASIGLARSRPSDPLESCALGSLSSLLAIDLDHHGREIIDSKP